MTQILPASPMTSSVARVSQARTSTTGRVRADDSAVCKGKVRLRVEGGWHAGSNGERTVHESELEETWAFVIEGDASAICMNISRSYGSGVRTE